MLAVGLGADDVSRRYLSTAEAPWSHDRVVVACHNSPSSVTLSGDAEAIEELRKILERDSVFNRVVKTGGRAYHSRHMEQAAVKYEEWLRWASSSSLTTGGALLPKASMFSTVKAAEIGHDQIPESYWADNLTSPVLFEQGVTLMLRNMPSINLLIEIGPHPALAGPLRQILQATNRTSDVEYLSTLKRGEDDGEQLLKLAGSLWAKNAPVSLDAVMGVSDRNANGGDKEEGIGTRAGSLLVDLPPYHWTYSTSCWSEPRLSREQREIQEQRHDILGRRVIGTSRLEPTWRNVSQYLSSLLEPYPRACLSASERRYRQGIAKASRGHHKWAQTPISFAPARDEYSIREILMNNNSRLDTETKGPAVAMSAPSRW